MSSPYAAYRTRFVSDTVATAAPERLLVMLYDRLLLDIERGEAALRAGDRVAAHSQLLHAQDILFELLGTLRTDAWEGAPQLASLYQWVIAELVTANSRLDADRAKACRELVAPLRDAWHEAATTSSVQRAGTPVPGRA